MAQILCFKNDTFYDGPEEGRSIRGEQFRALVDLCFAHADRFSLHRQGWAGSQDSPLEMALRPYCLGEYDSYRTNLWFEREYRDKFHLYPATEETKAIFLTHIPHLFGAAETGETPEHEAYVERKYALYHRYAQAACEMMRDFIDRMGPDYTEAAYDAYEKEAFQEAHDLWLQLFDEGDFYSFMDDPCFFRGDTMFFDTISHERDCYVHVFSETFGQQVQALGEWVDWSDRVSLPLLSLEQAPGLLWYGR